MPSAANLRFQDYQFQQSTPQGYWRWTTRMDVTGPSPAFTIRDVNSPYGLLRDSVPIPGDVIQAMSESIGNLQDSFSPTILLSPITLLFTVDEGRGVGSPQQINVTNTGVFGSLLNASITSSAPYIKATPSQMGNLASTEQGCIEVTVDSTTLLSGSSPYLQTLTFQDPSATNSPLTVPVSVTVLPKALIQTSLATLTFYATKPVSGPFAPIPSQSFLLSNAGPSISKLDYSVQRLYDNSTWLASFTPSTGTLLGGSAQPVLVTVAPPQNCMAGTYTEILRISGYSSNKFLDVQVSLVVS